MTKMKRILTLAITGLYLSLVLAGCGGSATSATSQSAPSEAASSSLSKTSSGSSAPSVTETESSLDLDTMLSSLTEAAQLGGTIDMADLDLTAGGVNLDNIAAWKGAESQLAVDNGGIVIVIQTKQGKADTVAQELEAFKASRMDDRYADFAGALANTKELLRI